MMGHHDNIEVNQVHQSIINTVNQLLIKGPEMRALIAPLEAVYAT